MATRARSQPLTLDERTAAQVAELFRALSDASRVRIVAALADCEMNVSALAQTVGISESAVSHHLRGLRQMRLVRARKNGRQVFYCLDDDHIAELFRRGLDHARHG
jgi:ArsR family transcriptional regulator